ncbi:MAG: hypothetical protein ACOZBL_04410 [Patescibacteria group bacterium]
MNSVEFTSCSQQTFLANSITAVCKPRHIQRYGTLFSLAYLIEFIFHSTPLTPNHQGTSIQSSFHSDLILSRIFSNHFTSRSSD